MCTEFAPIMFCVWVCTMFDPSLLVEKKFTQFTLSELLCFFVYTKFTQVYTVCTEFAPNKHRVYISPFLFSGEEGGVINMQI